MSSSYRRNRGDRDQGPGNDEFTVPYRDAHPDGNEKPLDDIDQFIIPGRDEHGGHQTVAFNCPPLLVHQVDVAVRTGLFPYINREALVRHAVVRHLRWLQDIRPESMQQHMAPEIETILHRCFEAQMQKKVKAAFEGLRETVLQCEAEGEHLEVMRLVNFVQVRLKVAGTGSVWQRRAWKRFIAEFGVYLAVPEGEVGLTVEDVTGGRGEGGGGGVGEGRGLMTLSNEADDAVVDKVVN